MGVVKTTEQNKEDKVRALIKSISNYFNCELISSIGELESEESEPLKCLSYSLQKSKYYLLGLLLEDVKTTAEKKEALAVVIGTIYNFYLDILKRILIK